MNNSTNENYLFEQKKQFLIDDFKKIGFNNIECTVGNDYFINKPTYYIKGYK